MTDLTTDDTTCGAVHAGAFVCSRERVVSAEDLQVVVGLQRLLNSLARPSAAGSTHDLSGGSLADQMVAVSIALTLAPIDCEQVVAVRRLREVTFLRPINADDVVRARASVRDVRPLRAEMSLCVIEVVLAGRDDKFLVQLSIDTICRAPGTAPRGLEPAPPAALDLDLWAESIPA